MGELFYRDASFVSLLLWLVFIERHCGPSRGRFSGTAQQQLIRLNHDIGEILVPPTPRRIRYQPECRRVLQALSATGLEPYELTRAPAQEGPEETEEGAEEGGAGGGEEGCSGREVNWFRLKTFSHTAENDKKC